MTAFHDSLLADLGGEAETSTIEAGYIRRLSQIEGALELLADDIIEKGIMTPRGRPRTAFTMFARTCETWDRLASRLPQRRRERKVDLARVLSGLDR